MPTYLLTMADENGRLYHTQFSVLTDALRHIEIAVLANKDVAFVSLATIPHLRRGQ